MLEGKNVNLRIVKKDDLLLFAEWVNRPEFFGEYDLLRQASKTEIERDYEKNPLELTGLVRARIQCFIGSHLVTKQNANVLSSSKPKKQGLSQRATMHALNLSRRATSKWARKARLH